VVAFFALNIFGPSITTFALLEHFVRSRDRAHRFLAAEQERSETLLLSIFPRPIAERLKVSQEVIAERCDQPTPRTGPAQAGRVWEDWKGGRKNSVPG
jgi:hypothetical protein